jgi:Cu/Ag efflux protein CusF
MKEGFRRAGIAAAIFAIALACGGSKPTSGESRGVVTAVDGVAHTITLDHEPIPGIMAAMTMTFPVAADVSLRGIEPGDRVEFRIDQRGTEHVVTILRREGR